MVPHVDVGALFLSIRRLFVGLLLVGGVLVAIGGVIVAQAGRDEATSADTAILILDGTAGAQAARVDRAVRLYLGGQISRIVLAGPDTAPARDALIARGVVKDKIAEATTPLQIAQIEQVQQILEQSRTTEAMLIAEPIESLRLLKIARDRGLMLHSVPAASDSSIDFGDLVEEVGRYLIYCFEGR
jgi:hypothetical protein